MLRLFDILYVCNMNSNKMDLYLNNICVLLLLEIATLFGFCLSCFHLCTDFSCFFAICCCGWSGGAKVLGKLSLPGRPTIWINVRQGPIALAVGAGGGCLDIFYSRLSFLSSFSLSLGDSPI